MPLDLFITPYTDPTKVPMGGQALGDLGNSLRDSAFRKQQLAQQQGQFEKTHALQSYEAQSRDRYYADQIDARREASRAMRMEKVEAKAQRLLELMEKAKTPEEREDYRQQLTSLGYASDESDTALPETAPSPAVSPMDIQAAGAAPPSPRGPGGAPPRRGAYATSEHMPDELRGSAPIVLDDVVIGANDEPAPGREQDRMGRGSPSLGIPGPPEMQKPKVSRGGRFTIKDREGNTVRVIDEPLRKNRQQLAVASIMEPYISGSSNAEEKAAASMAQRAADAAIASGQYTVQEAAQLGVRAYEKEMGRFKLERRPGAVPVGGGGGIMSKEDRMRKGGAFDDTLAVVKEARAEEAVVKAREAVSRADQIEGLLDSDDAFQNRAALSEHLHALIGASQTRTEIENTLGGAGKVNLLRMQLNGWTDGGRMPDDIRRGLQKVSLATRNAAQKRIDQAGEKAYNFIKKNVGTMSDDEREQAGQAAFEMITGRGRAAPTGGSGARGGSTGSAAPKGGAADDRKKAQIEEAKRLLRGGK